MIALPPLTGHQRRYLRSLAHPLKPVVQVGRAGLTEPVVAEIQGALEHHELIKIKVGRDCPTELAELAELIERQTGARVAELIGHVVIAYKPRPKDPKITLPKKRRVRATSAQK